MPSVSLPAVLAATGAVVSAGSAVAGGISQGHALGYQAQVARNNATIAGQNAEYATQAGAVKTEQAGLKARAQLGQVRTSLAANGLDVNSGSAADVQTSQREIGALDQETVAHNAALETYGYKTQVAGYTDQSKLLNREAAFAPIEGAFKGLGSLISAAPGIADKFGWMQSGTPGDAADVNDLFASYSNG